ncbi:MAG: tryptophan--tRNA ligase [Candidatus Altiarchaeota archaeon]|nr:tryptophan--tRNA ligase [Candidatus Altiarchaeota archaeon]
MTSSRLDPWGAGDIDDYQNLFREFGIESFEAFTKRFSENRYVRRRIIFGHRDFGRISDAIEKRKPYAMMTGLMPSGKFHFGHKMVADQIIWYQGMGAEVFLCSADLEAIVVRDIPPEDARRIAIEEYLTNYVALGLSEKNLVFWFQTDYKVPYYRLRDMLSKKVTLNELRAIYGGDLSTGKLFSAITQAADIMHPQLKEYGGPRPVVVPVGVDQDPHMRLTRDLASRFHNEYGFISPSSTYHKFMHGLSGGKMSSSNPSSYIALTEEPETAKKKIMSSKTGGRATVKEQKELGGVPEDCMVYEMLVYHLVEDDKALEAIYSSCRSGERVCGECKKACAELLEGFLKEHQKRRKAAGKTVKKILDRGK